MISESSTILENYSYKKELIIDTNDFEEKTYMITSSNKNIPNKKEVSNKLISVIIPVYNVETYLLECIHSVQNNTYTNLEIICINDGSTDQCGIILDSLASEDKRIKVLYQENQGVSAARNAGLDYATGEYIAFIDSDDCIYPSYFETLLNCMTEKNADIVVCGCRRFNENEAINMKAHCDIRYKRLSDREFFNHYYARHMIWARLYKKEQLDSTRFANNVSLSEDTLFNLLVVGFIKTPIVYEIDAELYFYRIRASSLVHTIKVERMIDASNWYYSHREMVLQNYTGDWNWLLLMQLIKATLSYRHTVRYVHRADEQIQHADYLLTILFHDLENAKELSLKENIVLRCMIGSSYLYRLYRIIQDPTMLTWEKQERSK